MEEAIASVPPDLEDLEALRGVKSKSGSNDAKESKPRKLRGKSKVKESSNTEA